MYVYHYFDAYFSGRKRLEFFNYKINENFSVTLSLIVVFDTRICDRSGMLPQHAERLHRPTKKNGMNFTCEYTTPMDFEPLNPNPVSEFPLDPLVFP